MGAPVDYPRQVHEDRTGRFQQAGDGTIFLDKLGLWRVGLRNKLLRYGLERA